MRVFLLLSLFVMSGCSTLMEAASPGDSSQGYQKYQNEKGEEVFRRERLVLPEVARLGPAQPLVPLQPAPTLPVQPSPTPPRPPTEPGLAAQRAREETQDPKSSSLPEASQAPGALPQEPHNWFFSADIATGQDFMQIGAGLGKEVFPFLDLRGGFAFFSGNDFYSGFDIGARAKLKIDFFEPFLGVGGYLGDLKACSTQGFVEVCEKKFLYAGYTEVGASFWRISLFFRNYNIEEAGKKIPGAQSYGVGYIYRF